MEAQTNPQSPAPSAKPPSQAESPLSSATTVVSDAAAPRQGKELLAATRPFAKDDVVRSWTKLFTVVGVIAAMTAIAALAQTVLPPAIAWPLRVAAAVVSGLSIVRLFIVYHDFLHGAILRDSTLAKIVLYPYGALVLAPPRIWRESHNYHHANTAKIIGSHIGSFAMVTTDMWSKMSAKDRARYKAVRHPLTILFGYVLVFMYGMCIGSLQKSVKKYWDSAVALALNAFLTVGLIYSFGFATAFLAYLLPLMVACATGGYLFYAQHNFPDMHVQPRHEWTFARAALESSSFMPMGPLMQWFTGNIGFHHVHHLNPQIPFYRLPEAMKAIPELQEPGVTTLAPRDIARCLSLKLWDPRLGKMVGYPTSESTPAATSAAA